MRVLFFFAAAYILIACVACQPLRDAATELEASKNAYRRPSTSTDSARPVTSKTKRRIVDIGAAGNAITEFFSRFGSEARGAKAAADATEVGTKTPVSKGFRLPKIRRFGTADNPLKPSNPEDRVPPAPKPFIFNGDEAGYVGDADHDSRVTRMYAQPPPSVRLATETGGSDGRVGLATALKFESEEERRKNRWSDPEHIGKVAVVAAVSLTTTWLLARSIKQELDTTQNLNAARASIESQEQAAVQQALSDNAAREAAASRTKLRQRDVSSSAVESEHVRGARRLEKRDVPFRAVRDCFQGTSVWRGARVLMDMIENAPSEAKRLALRYLLGASAMLSVGGALFYYEIRAHDHHKSKPDNSTQSTQSSASPSSTHEHDKPIPPRHSLDVEPADVVEAGQPKPPQARERLSKRAVLAEPPHESTNAASTVEKQSSASDASPQGKHEMAIGEAEHLLRRMVGASEVVTMGQMMALDAGRASFNPHASEAAEEAVEELDPAAVAAIVLGIAAVAAGGTVGLSYYLAGGNFHKRDLDQVSLRSEIVKRDLQRLGMPLSKRVLPTRFGEEVLEHGALEVDAANGERGAAEADRMRGTKLDAAIAGGLTVLLGGGLWLGGVYLHDKSKQKRDEQQPHKRDVETHGTSPLLKRGSAKVVPSILGEHGDVPMPPHDDHVSKKATWIILGTISSIIAGGIALDLAFKNKYKDQDGEQLHRKRDLEKRVNVPWSKVASAKVVPSVVEHGEAVVRPNEGGYGPGERARRRATMVVLGILLPIFTGALAVDAVLLHDAEKQERRDAKQQHHQKRDLEKRWGFPWSKVASPKVDLAHSGEKIEHITMPQTSQEIANFLHEIEKQEKKSDETLIAVLFTLLAGVITTREVLKYKEKQLHQHDAQQPHQKRDLEKRWNFPWSKATSSPKVFPSVIEHGEEVIRTDWGRYEADGGSGGKLKKIALGVTLSVLGGILVFSSVLLHSYRHDGDKSPHRKREIGKRAGGGVAAVSESAFEVATETERRPWEMSEETVTNLYTGLGVSAGIISTAVSLYFAIVGLKKTSSEEEELKRHHHADFVQNAENAAAQSRHLIKRADVVPVGEIEEEEEEEEDADAVNPGRDHVEMSELEHTLFKCLGYGSVVATSGVFGYFGIRSLVQMIETKHSKKRLEKREIEQLSSELHELFKRSVGSPAGVLPTAEAELGRVADAAARAATPEREAGVHGSRPGTPEHATWRRESSVLDNSLKGVGVVLAAAATTALGYFAIKDIKEAFANDKPDGNQHRKRSIDQPPSELHSLFKRLDSPPGAEIELQELATAATRAASPARAPVSPERTPVSPEGTRIVDDGHPGTTGRRESVVDNLAIGVAAALVGLGVTELSYFGVREIIRAMQKKRASELKHGKRSVEELSTELHSLFKRFDAPPGAEVELREVGNAATRAVSPERAPVSPVRTPVVGDGRPGTMGRRERMLNNAGIGIAAALVGVGVTELSYLAIKDIKDAIQKKRGSESRHRKREVEELSSELHELLKRVNASPAGEVVPFAEVELGRITSAVEGAESPERASVQGDSRARTPEHGTPEHGMPEHGMPERDDSKTNKKLKAVVAAMAVATTASLSLLSYKAIKAVLAPETSSERQHHKRSLESLSSHLESLLKRSDVFPVEQHTFDSAVETLPEDAQLCEMLRVHAAAAVVATLGTTAFIGYLVHHIWKEQQLEHHDEASEAKLLEGDGEPALSKRSVGEMSRAIKLAMADFKSLASKAELTQEEREERRGRFKKYAAVGVTVAGLEALKAYIVYEVMELYRMEKEQKRERELEEQRWADDAYGEQEQRLEKRADVHPVAELEMTAAQEVNGNPRLDEARHNVKQFVIGAGKSIVAVLGMLVSGVALGYALHAIRSRIRPSLDDNQDDGPKRIDPSIQADPATQLDPATQSDPSLGRRRLYKRSPGSEEGIDRMLMLRLFRQLAIGSRRSGLTEYITEQLETESGGSSMRPEPVTKTTTAYVGSQIVRSVPRERESGEEETYEGEMSHRLGEKEEGVKVKRDRWSRSGMPYIFLGSLFLTSWYAASLVVKYHNRSKLHDRYRSYAYPPSRARQQDNDGQTSGVSAA